MRVHMEVDEEDEKRDAEDDKRIIVVKEEL